MVVVAPVWPNLVAQPQIMGGRIVQVPLQRLKSIDQWQAVARQIRAMPRIDDRTR